jgi:FK506-binding protein 3
MSVERKWSAADLAGVTKKDLVEFLQKNGSNAYLKRHKINGQLASVTKNANKVKLDEAHEDLFATKEFRSAADDEELAKAMAATSISDKPTSSSSAPTEKKKEAPKAAEGPKYKKAVSKKGDGDTYPKKNDTVSIRFKGTCKSTGKVFQDITGKKDSPFEVKVGVGKLIRGWDEALLTMSVGEKATVTIEPEWGYGAKGLPDGNIGPNETLIFEIELLEVK